MDDGGVRVAFFGKPDAAAFWANELATRTGSPLLGDPRQRARTAAALDRVGYSNLWSAAIRVVEAREAGESVVSPSCALDEVGLQGVGYARLAQEYERVSALVPSIEGPDGKPLLSPEAARRAQEAEVAGGILRVLFQQSVEEASALWDRLYFCRFAGDEEVDGLGPGSGEVVDAQIEYVLRSSGVQAFDRVVELPADEGKAREAFEGSLA